LELHTISSLKRATLQGPLPALLHVQVESVSRKETREGKPFFEVTLADAEARFTLRAWSDGPAFASCEGLPPGAFLAVEGEFSQGAAFGLESRRWICRPLAAEDREALLGGPPELREKQRRDFEFIAQSVRNLSDPRLRGLAELFLQDYGERYRRAAAARSNHHARRGGLVEHVAQMLRAALALAEVYPVNRDLLVAGVLFHDAGKLWENGLPAEGFQMPYDERGELLGHITIGIELLNALWRKLMGREDAKLWAGLLPSSEDVRLHLLHLVAAHHGELQFGSPVPPKTPEAWMLHFVDNIDAKWEMLQAGYANAKRLAPRIQERVWPLPGNLVAPLPPFPKE
jgi:3'-5' exoribonuclease